MNKVFIFGILFMVGCLNQPICKIDSVPSVINKPLCGNLVCELPETERSCPKDCNVCINDEFEEKEDCELMIEVFLECTS